LPWIFCTIFQEWILTRFFQIYPIYLQQMTRILFLCYANSCRSQMAEGFARARKIKDVEIESAGTTATHLHPVAIKVMDEVNINISTQKSKSLDSLDNQNFDVVITLCGKSAEQCPLMPGHPETVNWNLPDPATAKGNNDEILEAFRKSRNEIRRLVDDFFDRGYLSALVAAKQCENMILNSISDGIIAHDLKRRIFFFNRAAEQITGYSRKEVLNRDCHDIFPGNFCGGKCQFCQNKLPDFDVKKQSLEIVTKSGDPRFVDMTIKTMLDPRGQKAGVLASFHDSTREHNLARRVGEIESFSGIIGRDKKMLELFDLIRELADANVPVLIQGESGTGKELVAAAIHNEGPRAGKLFVPVNCGALPESLLESELFGHVKGAFTGAIRDKKGRFELADGGTIFLDEIGDISPAMQVKLMRVLQEGEFQRVGSEKTMKVNVRVISATNKDIAKEMASGRFRDDLYYRLSVVPIRLPPLRERRTDIPLIADLMLKRIMAETGRKGIAISPAAMDMMISCDWPGNVRELQNWIQFALVKCRGNMILPEHLPPALPGGAPSHSYSPDAELKTHRRRKLNIEAVKDALAKTNQNRLEAAKLLGVSRATFYRFLESIDIPS